MSTHTGKVLSDVDQQALDMWTLALNGDASMPLVWRAERLHDGPWGLRIWPDYVASAAALELRQ